MGMEIRGSTEILTVLLSDVPGHLQGISLCLVNIDVSNFGRELDIPDLSRVGSESYDWFLYSLEQPSGKS